MKRKYLLACAAVAVVGLAAYGGFEAVRNMVIAHYVAQMKATPPERMKQIIAESQDIANGKKPAATHAAAPAPADASQHDDTDQTDMPRMADELHDDDAKPDDYSASDEEKALAADYDARHGAVDLTSPPDVAGVAVVYSTAVLSLQPGALVCDSWDAATAAQSAFQRYESNEIAMKDPNYAAQYRALHGVPVAPNASGFGCVLVPAGQPMKLINASPMQPVAVKLPDGSIFTGVTQSQLARSKAAVRQG